MAILYIFLSYMFMLGMILGETKTIDDVKYQHIIFLVFSPIILPIMLGLDYNTKN